MFKMSCDYGMAICTETHGATVAARLAEMTDHDTMVARILAWYGAATAEQVADGVRWYDGMGAILRDTATAHGYAAEIGTEIAAILSPRADWDANLKCAIAVLAGGWVTGPILHSRVAEARAYLAGEGTLRGPKVRAFACNLAGCTDCVTVDTWHARIATGAWDAGNRLACPCYHAAIAAATRTAAVRVGLTPRDLQAVVWVAIRAANPKGRERVAVPA